MAIYAQDTVEYTPLAIGNYAARCCMMVEIGTVEESFEGKDPKKKKKVWIRWELPLELRDDGKPHIVSKEYGLSMNEKATLRKDLDSWRGVAFTADEAKKFDITKLLGKTCMINILHNKKGYADVDKVTSVPKGYNIPPSILGVTSLSYDQWDQEIFESLPEFIKNKMMKSDEYQAMFGPKETMPQAKETMPQPVTQKRLEPVVAGNEDTVDELPF